MARLTRNPAAPPSDALAAGLLLVGDESLKLEQFGFKDAVRAAPAAGVGPHTAQAPGSDPAPNSLDIDPHPSGDLFNRQHPVLTIHAVQCSASRVPLTQCNTMQLSVVQYRYTLIDVCSDCRKEYGV